MLQRATELTKRERLGARIPVMELENRRRARVSAVETSSTASSDQVSLPVPSPLLERSISLCVAFPSPRFAPLLRVAFSGWRLRCVVCSEWRARQAKTAPVEPAQLPVDHDLSWEWSAAGFANLLLARPYDRPARTTKPTERFALKTVVATVKVNALPVDDRVGRKVTAAASARLYNRTLVLSTVGVKSGRAETQKPSSSTASAPRGGFEPPTY